MSKMMESLLIFPHVSGNGDIVSSSSSATMNANTLFQHNHNNGNVTLKRRGARSRLESGGHDGFDEHSLLPYTSSPFVSSQVDEHEEEIDLRNQLAQKEKDLVIFLHKIKTWGQLEFAGPNFPGILPHAQRVFQA